MSIAENTALFSLLGTTYGGDGQVTFALPDLRGRVAVGTGQGPGLSAWDLGEVTGTPQVTLTQGQIPAHIHSAIGSVLPASGNTPNTSSPQNAFMSVASADIYGSAIGSGTMGPDPFTLSVAPQGGNQPHENMMPYLALNFIIATEGIYPSRN